MGRLHYIVKLDDGYIFKRHIDQLLSTNIQAETLTNAHSSPEQLMFQHASIYNPNLYNSSEDGPVASQNQHSPGACDNAIHIPHEDENPDLHQIPRSNRESSRQRKTPGYLEDYVLD